MDRDETPVELPGITIPSWVRDQVERRRLLKESMTGKPAKFSEVLSEVVTAAVSRTIIA